MQIQELLTTIQHINWFKLIHNHHARHYMWEVSKVLIPTLITGFVTFITMRIVDGRNKKRWLNDGHLKRKIELEIEIRKFLLGIKANTSNKYEILADWDKEQDDFDEQLIEDFNKEFEALLNYLQTQENPNESNNLNYKKIFALMDEYACYVPKINNLFSEFKAIHENIFELKSLYENGDSATQANIIDGDTIQLVKKRPEHFMAMINTYLRFQVAIDRILKKITVNRIK